MARRMMIRMRILHVALRALSLAALVVLAAVPLVGQHGAVAQGQSVVAPEQAVERPAATGSPDALIAEHGCWAGQGPAGVIPGHVVATLPGHSAPTYGGRKLTGAALGQLFDGRDAGLTVHAFCR